MRYEIFEGNGRQSRNLCGRRRQRQSIPSQDRAVNPLCSLGSVYLDGDLTEFLSVPRKADVRSPAKPFLADPFAGLPKADVGNAQERRLEEVASQHEREHAHWCCSYSGGEEALRCGWRTGVGGGVAHSKANAVTRPRQELSNGNNSLLTRRPHNMLKVHPQPELQTYSCAIFLRALSIGLPPTSLVGTYSSRLV